MRQHGGSSASRTLLLRLLLRGGARPGQIREEMNPGNNRVVTQSGKIQNNNNLSVPRMRSIICFKVNEIALLFPIHSRHSAYAHLLYSLSLSLSLSLSASSSLPRCEAVVTISRPNFSPWQPIKVKTRHLIIFLSTRCDVVVFTRARRGPPSESLPV